MKITRPPGRRPHGRPSGAAHDAREPKPTWSVVGEAGDGARGVVAVATKLEPDVAIVDLAMPGMGGLAAIPRSCGRRRRGRRCSSSRCTRTRPTYTRRCAPARAAIVLKSARKEELLVRDPRGPRRRRLSSSPRSPAPVLRRLVGDARVGGRGRPADGARDPDTRGGRRRQEQQGDRRGARDRRGTVKTHLRRLFEKLGAADRAQAVAIALRQTPDRLIAVTRSGDTPRHSKESAPGTVSPDSAGWRAAPPARSVRMTDGAADGGRRPAARARRGRRKPHRTPRGPRPGAPLHVRSLLVERDRVPRPAPEWRKGVPQARHVHVLLKQGERIVADYFPGSVDELVRGGSSRVDMARRHALALLRRLEGALRERHEMLSQSRAFLEWKVRARVAALPNVRLLGRAASVTGLAWSSAGRVRGVRLGSERDGRGRARRRPGRRRERSRLAHAAAGCEDVGVSTRRARRRSRSTSATRAASTAAPERARRATGSALFIYPRRRARASACSSRSRTTAGW